MKKRGLLLLGVVLLAVGIVGSMLLPKEKEKETADSFFNKSDIVYVGSHDPGFPVITQSWTDPFPQKARFILIDNEEVIDESKQNVLQQLIEDRHVVLFYGENINKNTLSDRMGFEIDTAIPDANTTQYLTLLGYGYSFTYQKNMMLYLSSNTSSLSPLTIQEYLYTQFTAF